MSIEAARHSHHSAEHNPQQTIGPQTSDTMMPGAIRIMHITPEETVASVLMTLRLSTGPVILALPEGYSQAFGDPAHFAQVQQVRPTTQLCFLVPPSRLATLTRYAQLYGLMCTSSLEQAYQMLVVHSQEQTSTMQDALPDALPDTSQMVGTANEVPLGRASLDVQGMVGNDEQEAEEAQGEEEESSGQSQAVPVQWPAQPVTPLPVGPSPRPVRSRLARMRARRGYHTLMVTMLAFLVIAGILLLPALLSAQPTLMNVTLPAVPPLSVGTIAFTSSGQLDPSSSQGLNDGIVVSLHNLAPVAPGYSYDGWLMPDSSDDTTPPLLLGPLTVTAGNAHLSYIQPDHIDLLARYSGFEVAEQPISQAPTTPPLDPRLLPYTGRIPNIPTPGDELHYSLLDHLRHLLAKDPTLQDIGLQGGLDIWLYRNTEKILEWSSAARDSWSPNQQGQSGNLDSIHRQMIRVLGYLDGSAYVETTGDVPPGTPLLVDPQAGRIGLLATSQIQQLPAYLPHIAIHLQGLIGAPGHTQAQLQLAIMLTTALTQVALQLQHVHQDAVTLVRMDDAQIKSTDALALLNDMVTSATNAYTGQFDPTVGGNTNGVIWIHNKLQGLATFPVIATSTEKP